MSAPGKGDGPALVKGLGAWDAALVTIGMRLRRLAARAGKSVAVLERGREFVTGEFPARFPEMRRELQVRGRRLRVGSAVALYDVRLGEDMNITEADLSLLIQDPDSNMEAFSKRVLKPRMTALANKLPG